jgi:hypothetical protein
MQKYSLHQKNIFFDMVPQRHDTNRSDTEEEGAELGAAAEVPWTPSPTIEGVVGLAVGSGVRRGVASAAGGQWVGSRGRIVGGGRGGGGRR